MFTYSFGNVVNCWEGPSVICGTLPTVFYNKTFMSCVRSGMSSAGPDGPRSSDSACSSGYFHAATECP